MTILVEFRITTDQFQLGAHIARHAGLRAELERIVPTEDHVIPYVWVTGTSQTLDDLTADLEQSDAIATVTTLDRLDVNGSDQKQQLYRIEWILEELDIINGIVSAGGVIMEGESVDDYWTLRFRFPDHDHAAQFYQHLADNDITDFSIESLFQLQSRSERGQQYDLTPDQREAITLAAQRGWFNTPREVTLEDLGEELGVSEQALSQRIRRANKKIVFSALNYPDGASE